MKVLTPNQKSRILSDLLSGSFSEIDIYSHNELIHDWLGGGCMLKTHWVMLPMFATVTAFVIMLAML